MVTVLFFIWGFEYGLLDVLNTQFQIVARMSVGQSIGIHSAYFGGYLFGPLTVGRLVLKYWGFRACYIVGLCTYACGTLVFWPSAVLTSFPAFLVSNFIVGFGLSILEVAANPFIALCGPPRYSEIRLNISQGVQAIGSIVSPLLARKVFFKPSLDAPSLIDTQWAYLGIALFTVLLAVAYYYVPLPEATDGELAEASERADCANDAKINGIGVIWITLGVGVFSQLCYVGAQEVVATTFNGYLATLSPAENTTNFMAIAHTAFAVSRFLAAGAGFFIKPRNLLLFFYAGAITFSTLTLYWNGNTGTALIITIFFFEGPLFSLIFAQTLRGLGRRVKDGSVLITAAICGGSIFPPIAVAAASVQDPQIGRSVALAAFAAGALYPIYLTLVPAARRQVDPVKEPGGAGRSGSVGSGMGRAGKALSFLGRKKGDGPVVEFRERSSEGVDFAKS
ncbi:hypothetical protein LTR28_005888 [Elasticomyces elasticus]|nr:hypothetical protein LTR28_005888 [Elasticomyces elasticus]